MKRASELAETRPLDGPRVINWGALDSVPEWRDLNVQYRGKLLPPGQVAPVVRGNWLKAMAVAVFLLGLTSVVSASNILSSIAWLGLIIGVVAAYGVAFGHSVNGPVSCITTGDVLNLFFRGVCILGVVIIAEIFSPGILAILPIDKFAMIGLALVIVYLFINTNRGSSSQMLFKARVSGDPPRIHPTGDRKDLQSFSPNDVYVPSHRARSITYGDGQTEEIYEPLDDTILVVSKWQGIMLAISMGLGIPIVLWILGHVYRFNSPAHPVALAVLVLCVIACDAVFAHFYYWISQSPRQSDSAKHERIAWLANRWNLKKDDARTQRLLELEDKLRHAIAASNSVPINQLSRQIEELRAQQHYCVGLLGFGVAWIALETFAPTVLLYPALMLMACAYLYVVHGRLDAMSRTAALTWMAFGHWLTQPHSKQLAPGLYRSPYGWKTKRALWTACLLAAAWLIMLPLHSYRAITYEWSVMLHDGRWAKAFLHYAPKLVEAQKWVRPGVARIERAFTGAEKQAPDLVQLEASGGLNSQSAEALLEAYAQGYLSKTWAIAFYNAVTRDTMFSMDLAIQMLICMVHVPLTLFVLLVVVGGRALKATSDIVEAPATLMQYHDHEAWDNYVARMQNSRHKTERRHLWLGLHATDDYPILLDRDILKDHAFIAGDTGARKTSKAFIPMLIQLLRSKESPPAIVVLDLKGDNAMFATVRSEAEKANRTFKVFTNTLDHATFAFNPLAQTNIPQLSLSQVCEIVLEALQLNHGAGYGRSYYSRLARKLLREILESRQNLQSFTEIKEVLAAGKFVEKGTREYEDAFELITVIEAMAAFPQLNVGNSRSTPRLDKCLRTHYNPNIDAVHASAIWMPDVIEKQQVIYFWLPAVEEMASVREIASLAVYALLTSAKRCNASGGKRQQTFLFIDEFQRLASQNFQVLLEQARGHGVGCVLATQSVGNLVTPDVDLTHAVLQNTRLKLCFAASNFKEHELWMHAMQDWELPKVLMTNTLLGEPAPSAASPIGTYSPAMMLDIGDNEHWAVCHVGRGSDQRESGSGYTQFSGKAIVAEMAYAMSKDIYEERMRSAWLDPNTLGTMVVTRSVAEANPEPKLEQAGPADDMPPPGKQKNHALQEQIKRAVAKAKHNRPETG